MVDFLLKMMQLLLKAMDCVAKFAPRTPSSSLSNKPSPSASAAANALCRSFMILWWVHGGPRPPSSHSAHTEPSRSNSVWPAHSAPDAPDSQCRQVTRNRSASACAAHSPAPLSHSPAPLSHVGQATFSRFSSAMRSCTFSSRVCNLGARSDKLRWRGCTPAPSHDDPPGCQKLPQGCAGPAVASAHAGALAGRAEARRGAGALAGPGGITARRTAGPGERHAVVRGKSCVKTHAPTWPSTHMAAHVHPKHAPRQCRATWCLFHQGQRWPGARPAKPPGDRSWSSCFRFSSVAELIV